MSDKQVTTDAEVIEASVVRPRRRIGLFLVIAAVLLALLGGGALWESTRLLRRIDGRISAATDATAADLRTRIDGINQRVEALANTATAVDSVKQELTQQLAALNERQSAMQQQVNAAVSSLANSPARQDSGWVLAEARHLLGIAEQRLRLERDVPTAIAAAESVDRRLADSNDPSLIPIREQVIAEISALRAVPVVDIPGILLTLSSLIDRIEELPLKGGDAAAVPADAEAAPAQPPAAAAKGWRAALSQIWKDLLSLVDVKSAAVPDDVIFDPQKRYLLQQGLRLELAAARLDALRGATQSFRAAIGRIDTQLERYFDTQSSAVMAARDALASLRTVDLAPTLPGFDQSLRLLAAQQSTAVAPPPAELPAAAPALPSPEAVDDPPPAADAAPQSAQPIEPGGVELDPESGVPAAPEPPDPNLTRPIEAAPTLVP